MIVTIAVEVVEVIEVVVVVLVMDESCDSTYQVWSCDGLPTYLPYQCLVIRKVQYFTFR